MAKITKDKVVEAADHPLIFAFAIVMLIVPSMAFLNWAFAAIGWSGPASLFKHP